MVYGVIRGLSTLNNSRQAALNNSRDALGFRPATRASTGFAAGRYLFPCSYKGFPIYLPV